MNQINRPRFNQPLSTSLPGIQNALAARKQTAEEPAPATGGYSLRKPKPQTFKELVHDYQTPNIPVIDEYRDDSIQDAMEIGTVRSNSKMTEQVPEVNKYGIV